MRIEDLKDTLLKIVKKGSNSRLVIEDKEKVYLDISINTSIIAVILAPKIGILAGLGSIIGKSEIKIIKENGEIINLKNIA